MLKGIHSHFGKISIISAYLFFNPFEQHHNGIHYSGGQVGVLAFSVASPSANFGENKLDKYRKAAFIDCVRYEPPLVVGQISTCGSHPHSKISTDTFQGLYGLYDCYFITFIANSSPNAFTSIKFSSTSIILLRMWYSLDTSGLASSDAQDTIILQCFGKRVGNQDTCNISHVRRFLKILPRK